MVDHACAKHSEVGSGTAGRMARCSPAVPQHHVEFSYFSTTVFLTVTIPHLRVSFHLSKELPPDAANPDALTRRDV